MQRKRRQYREFRFTIDAFTPSTIPLLRLAEYMHDFAILLGNEKSVHPGERLEEGSTVLVAKVEPEAEPKVRERLRAIRTRNANDRAMEAAARLDDRLADDNAKGVIADPAGTKVIEFPGRHRFQMPAFGPIQQAGTFQGVPIKIGGENDPVPVHLEDGKDKHIILARRSLAKQLAPHLFTSVVRVEGQGRWNRAANGVSELLSFTAESFQVIENADLRKNIAELRSIESGWKQTKDPLTKLDAIRRGIQARMTDALHILPDVLCPGLRAVICGVAAGNKSARQAQYYAAPNNRFWEVLNEVGLTPRKLRPEEFFTLPKFGLGLTDIAKFVSGNDATLAPESFDVPSFLAAIRCHRPGIVAFNGKTAARIFYGLSARADLRYGVGPRVEDFQQIFILPSTSGAAGRYWDVKWWREFAHLVLSSAA